MTGGVVGTVAYMSPEQARGAPVGPESDVYSASLVVYEGLAGSNPVNAPSPAETARRAAAGGIPRPGVRAARAAAASSVVPSTPGCAGIRTRVPTPRSWPTC